MARTLERPYLALDLDGEGSHPAAATETGADPARAYSGKHLVRRVLAAESAGFNAVIFADHALDASAHEHPVNLTSTHAAAYVAPRTHRIALIAETDAVFTEPFHVAMALMTVDHSSLGRAGWLVRATGTAAEAGNVGRETPSAERINHEVADAIEVNRRLWDSWEDDAIIRDVESGRFIDADKIHFADFEGENYSVKSASIVPRSPQGQIPVIAGAEFAGADADVVEVSADSVDGLIQAANEARANKARIVTAKLSVVLDARGRTAAERLEDLNAHGTWTPRALVTGDAATVAAELERVLESVNGLRLSPAVTNIDGEELAEAVLPILRSRIDIAENAAGTTTRELLGLSRPASRYATISQEENR